MNKGLKDREYWKGIWELFINGNRLAFNEIYNEYVDFLFAYGMKITPNRELVQDNIQDLFVNLCKYRKNLTSPDYLEFYLTRSLRRMLIKEVQKNRKVANMDEEELLSFQLKFDLEEQLIEGESADNRMISLQKMLASIDSRKRELLYLKFYSGLNYREIGDLLGIRPDTAKKQVYRLLEDLRDRFGQKLMELFCMYFKV
ncbi:sigma-70 family RNA polymerase sigma factor [uncultured Sunxiuqinia sp.]|uniref:RNA polymerase sigma factor n=1 Tax=uncultured Sunxiuqinia sp. TaxID=1573825 RepID=UPI002AA8D00F|nr:sigma-70 family RNA polymerase sigma factor [uncultured Sunxiuqinia sp.]